MHRHSAANVSLQRLQTLPSEEHALYSRLFRDLVGNAPVAVADAYQVAAFLQQSGLPKETLRKIWELADRTNDGTLDFENFCVACRLTAHAQTQAPGASIEESSVAEIPSAPPDFTGAGGDAVPNSSRSSNNGHVGQTSKSLAPSNREFDFEAMALGVDTDSSKRPTRPPRPPMGGDFGMVASPGLLNASGAPPADVFTGSPGSSPLSTSKKGKVKKRRSRSPGEQSRESDTEEGPATAAVLAEALLPGPGQARGSTVAEEMVEGRQNFDELVVEKTRYETRIEQARSRLEALRQERHENRASLTQGRADLQHMWRMLDFERGLIEEVEREIAALREARESFSAEELAHVERFISEIADRGDGTVSSQERSFEILAANIAMERSSVDVREMQEIGEQVIRGARRKLEVQAKHQLLLAAQQQAEQDRNYAESELEAARETLARLRADRMQLLEQQAATWRAAMASTHDDGLAAVPPRKDAPPTACAGDRSFDAVASGGVNQRESLAFKHRKAAAAHEPDIATWWRSMTGAKSQPDSEGANLSYRSQPRWTKFGGLQEDLSKGPMLKTS